MSSISSMGTGTGMQTGFDTASAVPRTSHGFDTALAVPHTCDLNAMDLSVPDYLGSERGTNLYHLYPDACSYSVGAGLFQAPA